MIIINNRQKKIKVDVKKLHVQAQKMLGVLDYTDFDLYILLTTNKSIHKLNKTFRNKDKSTDILSFPFHPNLKPGQRIKVTSENDKNLGDIIISLEHVQKDASEKWNRSFEYHLTALIAHGIAHLLGYDHHTDTKYKEMLKLEERLTKSISL